MPLLSCTSGYDSDLESNSVDAEARRQYMAQKNIPEINQDCLWMDSATVVVKRGRHGYGFTVLGSSPVKVGHVKDGSPGAVAGLQRNDCIIRINGQNVSRSMADSIAKIVKQSEKQIILDIYRPSDISNSNDLNRPSEVITSTPLFSRKPLQPINEYDEYTQQPITAQCRSLIGKGEPLQEVLSQRESYQESGIDVVRRRAANRVATAGPPARQDLSSQEVERQDSVQKLLRLTEDYVKQMLFGIQRYSHPLRHCIISPAEHKTLFQNMEQLVTLSDNLVHQLSENSVAYSDRGNTPDRYIDLVGGVCQPNVSLMADSYESYCNGIKSSFRLLKELKAVPEFDQFTQNAMLEYGQSTIAGFIQKPLEYAKDLLVVLQQILATTPLQHHDYQDLAYTVNTFRNACNRINENNMRRSQSTLSIVSSMNASRSMQNSMSPDRARSAYSNHSNNTNGSNQQGSPKHAVQSGAVSQSSQSGTSSHSSQSRLTSLSHVTTSSQSAMSISSIDLEVLDVQSRLVYKDDTVTYQLATPSRHMIYSGALQTVDGAVVSNLWVVMMSDLLLLTKITDDEYLTMQEDPILLHNIISVESSRINACEFSLLVDCRSPHINSCPYNASRLVTLRAPSDEQKCTWTNILEQRVSSCKVQQEDMARQAGNFV